MRKPLRGGAAAMSLAVATMVLAATQPQAISTPVIGLAALVIPDVTPNPASDVVAEIFDYKAVRTDTDPDSTVLSVGEGSDDAATLAELLDPDDRGDNVFHINYEFDASAPVQVLNVFTDSNALATHDSKPSVDQSGGVNCAGATICHTDPSTQLTTVTYPDGVVAVVERINDIAVVTYKTLGAAVLGHLDISAPATVPPSPAPASAPTDSAPAAPDTPAPTDPTAAPAASTGPRLNVVRPAPDFTPGRSGTSTTSPGTKFDLSGTTDKFVTDVLSKVTDTVNHLFNRDDAPKGIGKPATPPSTGEE